MRWFWREKNANIYIEKNEVVVPNKQELFEELVKKFEEKLQMINIIFNKEKRSEYLAKKNKIIPEGTPEIIIQQKIGTRVVIDLLQLIKDTCELKGFKQDFSHVLISQTQEEIYNSIKLAIEELKSKTNDSLIIIHKNIISLIEILSLSYDNLEQERQRIEEKEGSFLKGKFVIVWKRVYENNL